MEGLGGVERLSPEWLLVSMADVRIGSGICKGLSRVIQGEVGSQKLLLRILRINSNCHIAGNRLIILVLARILYAEQERVVHDVEVAEEDSVYL